MKYLALPFALLLMAATAQTTPLRLNDADYFERQGLNVIVFSDIYPDGHQTGVTIIQHGQRVAANGDVRLEASPGQWSPMPTSVSRTVDREHQTITQRLAYPDPTKNRRGFNPIDYPDLNFSYDVSVTPDAQGGFRVRVDLERPLPAEWIGKVGFNLELFPGDLFGKAYLLDGQSGVFPRQADGPIVAAYGGPLAAPLAHGRALVVAPEDDLRRLRIESRTGELELLDGRANHNNGWFIVRSLIPAGATHGAVEWSVSPNVVEGWRYAPVIQVSQLGYHPDQPKRAVIETDRLDTEAHDAIVYRLTENGREEVLRARAAPWAGHFLRYNYLIVDFSAVKTAGMYEIVYGESSTQPFKIGADVFDRHAWQPTLEYFLPIQMCHMLVREKYRTWHGLDHADDVRMAPVNLNHFDGYAQGPSTLTRFQPGEHVPGMDRGGWHDAGDYDLRVESQMGTVWLLSKMVTEFGLDYDATLIDEDRRIAEIHTPDGKNDVQQQIEHGLLSVLGGYRAMGRLYRGIIEPTLSQYVLLGDISTQTDGVIHDGPGAADDRWVFTEDNPDRELNAAAGLAAASVALRGYDPAMSAEALAAAREIAARAIGGTQSAGPRAFALSELILATRDAAYVRQLVAMKADIVAHIADTGWAVGQVRSLVRDAAFWRDVEAAVRAHEAEVETQSAETPYGVPYRPRIWGAGWDIQQFGVRQYFLHKAWPRIASAQPYVNALNFVLGAHPGDNTESFASGVGARSATVAYGANRADWSYIPGGVISGTNLVRPDLPELKVWPYFWQQSEYVMGGGAENYMFLVLAVDRLYQR
ncbi:MAG TPA: cellulase N-terminal Ig-like domain-containing protein [Caulobacterales bacterium]|nr:cellulase N-terminal Ig-like domain-containing protein [Caulobacterales bacterium]